MSAVSSSFRADFGMHSKGCGIRLEYLRIPMTESEQRAFWNTMNYDVVRKLSENERRHDAQ